jgi:acetyl esterase/lipase
MTFAVEVHSYGPSAEQVFDLYRAATPNAPLAFYIHGGAFIWGDKRTEFPDQLRRSLLARGFAVVSINYRLKTPYPAPMDDGEAALAFVRAHAAEYGIDTSRIVLMGGSAGAGIAQWMAYHDQDLSVVAVGLLNAQTTYTPSRWADIFGAPVIVPDWVYRFQGVTRAEGDDPANRPVLDQAGPLYWYDAGDPPAYYVYRLFGPLNPDDPATFVHRSDWTAPILKAQASEVTVETTADLDSYNEALRQLAIWASTKVAIPAAR